MRVRSLYTQSRRTLVVDRTLSFCQADPTTSTHAPQLQPPLHRCYKSTMAVEDTHDDGVIHIKTPGKKTIPFLLADIGEGITEVEALQWFVSPGDTVRQFDRICEVQSDKATVEITSRYDGVVESISDQEEIIRVGTPLMHIQVDRDDGDDDATADHGPLHNVDTEKDKLHIPTFASSFDIGDELPKRPKVFATPAVRKLSMDYDLDLGHIIGTGPKGRVLKSDVLQILRDQNLIETEEITSSQESVTAPTSQADPMMNLAQDETVAIRGYNRLMVKTMTESLSIPHMCYSDEVNMNRILEARASGVKVLPFAIKAASQAIGDYPVLNSSLNLEEMTVTYHANHNIGVAMDTPRGLCVPVIKGCQNLSVLEISNELDRLKAAVSQSDGMLLENVVRNLTQYLELQAAEGNLSEADITGATFTLSNIGAIGGTYMSPIVASPQVAIGAMGKIQRLPRFGEDNQVEEVNILQISWGGDHRVVDGATMARFSNRWKDLMEDPMSMIFCMK